MPASGVGKHLRLRLFLEGREIPVIGAQVSAAIGACASANIQILPTDRAWEFQARTLVHLFFHDFEHTVGGFDQEGVTDGRTDLDAKYRLLFSGEIVGFNFVQTPTSRAIVLQCLDTANHWDSTYQFMMSLGGSGQNTLVDNASKFLGSEGFVFTDTGTGDDPVSVMNSIVQEGSPRTPALQNITGLLSGIVRILESVGGVADQLLGMNDFETISEMRLKNLFQIAAEEGDDTASTLFSAGSFVAWITGTLSQRGGLISIRDMINILNAYIYYETVPNPAPRYVLGTTWAQSNSFDENGPAEELPEGVGEDPKTMSLSERGRKELQGSEAYRGLVYDDKTGKSIASYEGVEGYATIGYGHLIKSDADKARFTPNLLNAPKGKVMSEGEAQDLFDEDMASRIATLRRILKVKTTQEMFDAFFSFMFNTGAGNDTFKRTVKLHNEKRYSTAGRSIINGTNTTKGKIHRGLLRRRAREGHLYLSTIPSEVRTPEKRPKTIESDKVAPEDQRRGARMLTQIWRPDVWFVAPPRCNVFFPEMYTRFTFQRNFMREVTRYQLRTHLELISDGVNQTPALTDKYFYAPHTDIFKQVLEAQNNLGELQKSLVLTHEKFVGVIPKLDRLSSLHFWSNQELNVARQERGLGSNPDDFANSTAAFNFFRERFSSRSMEVSGYFNPYPVVGFPGIVIRRGAPPLVGVGMDEYIDAVKKREVPFKLAGNDDVYMPSQSIGMIASLSHSVDQSGGNSSFNFSHARTHMGADGMDDEYLRQSLKQGRELDHLQILTSYDAQEAIADGDTTAIDWIRKATPQPEREGGEVVIPEPSTKGGGFLEEGKDGPRGGEITAIKTSGQFLKYDKQRGSSAGIISRGAVDPDAANYRLLYTTVQIFEKKEYTAEEKETLKSVRVDIPFETSIFPPWMSQVYYNDNIGKSIYGPWFGTGSVVDEQNISERKVVSRRHDRVADTTITNVASTQIDPLAASPAGESPVNTERREETSIHQEISTAEAIDILAILYGAVKSSSELDANRFVQNYIYRPIATLQEVLGSDDLQFDQSGNIETGWEGFHSRAVLYLDGLKGLMDDPDVALPHVVSSRDNAAVDKTLDPRIERTNRVLRYLDDIVSHRGLLG